MRALSIGRTDKSQMSYDTWKTTGPGDSDEMKPCRGCGKEVAPDDDFCGGCEEEQAILDDVEAARVSGCIH